MDRFTGGCLCGDVRIVASGRPYRVGLCHCLDCRKHHGALFHASAMFPQDAVTIEGETRDYAGRFFCPRCGSSVFGRSADEIEVNLGIPGCPRPADADLRDLDRPPRVLVAAVSAHAAIRPRSRRHGPLRGVGRAPVPAAPPRPPRSPAPADEPGRGSASPFPVRACYRRPLRARDPPERDGAPRGEPRQVGLALGCGRAPLCLVPCYPGREGVR